jgi:hypothetical protein
MSGDESQSSGLLYKQRHSKSAGNLKARKKGPSKKKSSGRYAAEMS